MFVRVLAVLVLVLLALVGYTGYQAVQVKDGLEKVAAQVDPATVDEIRSGDAGSLRARLRPLKQGAAQAARNSRGPGWWIAGRLPRIGDDVQAIRTVSDVSDKLASGVLPQVVHASTQLQNVNAYDGPDAVRQIKRDGKALVRADRELRRQKARIAAIDTKQLDPRLAGPIRQLQVALGAASRYVDDKVSRARQALASVPPVS